MQKKQWMILSLMIGWAASGCLEPEGGSISEDDLCPAGTLKAGQIKGHCGCDAEDVINILTGRYTCDEKNNTELVDLCPNDPNKLEPGVCGCGFSDDPDDKTGEIWCANLDLCPNDPNKMKPGVCGCGVPDIINKSTGVYDCLTDDIDLCPDDPDKTRPGICDCGVSDTTFDAELANTVYKEIPKCLTDKIDLCPSDKEKRFPGICGCGVADVDTDGDTVLDCQDACPQDKEKWEDDGVCGCGVKDTPESISDDDGDGVPNCIDICPNNVYKDYNIKNVPNINGKYSDDVEKCVLEDGTPDCSRIYTVYETKPFCALILSTPKDLMEMRDAWNNGVYEELPPDKAIFILKEDIDLGSSIEKLEDWIGIGTVTYPFSGTFLGSQKKISATAGGTPLMLGSVETDNIGLFSVVKGADEPAIIDSLQVDLSFTGNNQVGILAGVILGNTNIKHISVTGNASGENHVGGLVGEAVGSALDSVSSNATVLGNGNAVGGLVGLLEDSMVTHAFVSGNTANIMGNESATEVGGFVGAMTEHSKISDAYASGYIVGYTRTGGFAGAIRDESSLINAFAFANVTCYDGPCAGMVAHVSGGSVVRNIYSTNYVYGHTDVPEVEPNPGDEPGYQGDEPTPPNDGEGGEGGNNGAGSGDDVYGLDGCSSVPAAGLIAEVCDETNTILDYYAWSDAHEVSVPEALVDSLQKFSFKNLIATLDNGSYLKVQLNKNINCDSKGVCISDEVKYEPWNQIQFRLNNMSLSIPAITSIKTTN